MTDKLKPCPFCGSNSVGLVDRKDPQGNTSFTVICVSCGASVNNYDKPQQATRKWNRRANNDK